MKVPCDEPSWLHVDKSPAADSRVLPLKDSPVKEPIVFKAPFTSVEGTTALISQNNNTKAVHNKENYLILGQALEDSGYSSLHNSHIEEDEPIRGRSTTVLTASGPTHQEKPITPKPSPTKCPEKRNSPTMVSVSTPIQLQNKRRDTSTPADHRNVPNLPILKFEHAVCKELAQSFQKNKKYDWSVISKLAKDYNLDRVIGGHMGLDYIDMFSSLLSRNMKCILTQILALLGDMDLISCKKVSKTWRQIILEDPAALKRCQQAEKALRESGSKVSGFTRDVAMSRVVMSCMQHIATSSTSSTPSSSSVKSFRNNKNTGSSYKGTFSRFNQFVEVASGLKPHESLRHCKLCDSPAIQSLEAQRATCTSASCQFDFCTCCKAAFHGSTPCRVVQSRLPFNVAQTSTILPGSARKRNIRRL